MSTSSRVGALDQAFAIAGRSGLTGLMTTVTHGMAKGSFLIDSRPSYQRAVGACWRCQLSHSKPPATWVGRKPFSDAALATAHRVESYDAESAL